jgi:hypothetical protein
MVLEFFEEERGGLLRLGRASAPSTDLDEVLHFVVNAGPGDVLDSGHSVFLLFGGGTFVPLKITIKDINRCF